MHEFPVDHPALPSLFDPSVPDNPVLWAVFKGQHAGRAVVDNVQSPAQCAVRTEAYLTFFSRQVSQTFLNQAIAAFQKAGEVWLVWPDTKSEQLEPPDAPGVIQRFEFFDYDVRSQTLADLRGSVPDGCEIRPIDRQLLQRCEWRSDVEFYCGSLDGFLANEMGLCLIHGDEIMVEAYVSSFGDTHAEIGAVTRAAYRGHGYAPIICAYLIQACEQRGYQAYWSCDAENQASKRVAQKLGFRQKKAYQILEYRAT
jgi:GNAT superfamily N-acetyltransferase